MPLDTAGGVALDKLNNDCTLESIAESFLTDKQAKVVNVLN